MAAKKVLAGARITMLNLSEYLPRVLDGVLARALTLAGAVVVEGPRACGKTQTALWAGKSFALLDDPATRELVRLSPETVLEGESPRVLDEWQLATELWDLVRRAVDFGSSPGRFILTGSSVPADDATRHSGAGRFLRVRQRTMSWWERGGSREDDAAGGVSVAGLFAGERPRAAPAVDDYASVVDRLCSSGFPAMIALSPEDAQVLLRSYLREVTHTDLPRLEDMRHRPAVLEQLLRAVARSVAQPVKFARLAADLDQVAPGIAPATVARYVELLERLFVVELQHPWAPKLRSRARLRSADHMHMADPGLAVAALGASPETLARDPETTGFLFESAVVHDLLVLGSPLDARVECYHDSNEHEIDAVILLPDGRWGAVEVKVGGAQVGAGAESLKKAIEQIDVSSVGEPAFRLVVTGNGGTFVLKDGTVTCPLSALMP
ncbi:MAG: DUF4143 domain-containing protein [Acidipropionibacterium sp.]|jgi:predicted AAA+ superfamily ATPase|nr:DUF4143 domain-containing protein [Acidipropionibacterium sp.]